MQKLFAVLLAAVIALFGVQWTPPKRERNLEIIDSPASLDGVTIT